MEHKTFLLMLLILIWGFSSLANGYAFQPKSGQCTLQPKARVNCGYPYISAQECNRRGCCFDSSIAGVIWCFFPADTEGFFKPVQQHQEPEQLDYVIIF